MALKRNTWESRKKDPPGKENSALPALALSGIRGFTNPSLELLEPLKNKSCFLEAIFL